MTRYKFIFTLLFVFFSVFFISINTLADVYLKTIGIEWSRLNGFIVCDNCNTLQAHERSIVSDPNSDFNRSRSATSTEFVLFSNKIELEIAGDLKDPKMSPSLILIADEEEVWEEAISSKKLKLEKDKWSTYQFDIPVKLIDQKVKLKIRTKPTTIQGSWIGIRDKIDFFQTTSYFNILSEKFQKLRLNYISAFLIGSILSYLLIFKIQIFKQNFSYIVFLIIIFAHFRTNTYFNFDEWDQINMGRIHGINAIFQPHNEHFKPVFFLLYFLENVLFKSQYYLYIIVNCILFTFCALLLRELIETIYPQISKNISCLISILFVVSSLNCENLQWAFEQCLLLMQICFYISMINCVKFYKTKQKIHLFISSIFCLIAPFCFGNGLILFIEIFLLSFIYLLLNKSLKANLKPFLLSNSLNFSCFTLAAIFYKLAKNPTSAPLVKLNIEELIKYFYVGTHFSGFLRAIGLAPFVESHNLESFLENFHLGVHISLLYFSHIALILLIFIFWYSKKYSHNKTQSLLCFFIGLSIILSSMILPSIGRSAFGTTQSLSLRYHTITLSGSLILIAPLLENLLLTNRKRLILFCYSLFVISSQLILGSRFVYFTTQDNINFKYATQLKAWEQNGKPAFLQPQYPENLVPGGNPDFVSQNLAWLDN